MVSYQTCIILLVHSTSRVHFFVATFSACCAAMLSCHVAWKRKRVYCCCRIAASSTRATKHRWPSRCNTYKNILLPYSLFSTIGVVGAAMHIVATKSSHSLFFFRRYSSCRYNERQLIDVIVVRRVRPRAEHNVRTYRFLPADTRYIRIWYIICLLYTSPSPRD